MKLHYKVKFSDNVNNKSIFKRGVNMSKPFWFNKKRKSSREIEKNEIEYILSHENDIGNFKDIDGDNVSYLIEYSEDAILG